MRSQSGRGPARPARPARCCRPPVELYDASSTATGMASRHFVAAESRLSSDRPLRGFAGTAPPTARMHREPHLRGRGARRALEPQQPELVLPAAVQLQPVLRGPSSRPISGDEFDTINQLTTIVAAQASQLMGVPVRPAAVERAIGVNSAMCYARGRLHRTGTTEPKEHSHDGPFCRLTEKEVMQLRHLALYEDARSNQRAYGRLLGVSQSTILGTHGV